MFEINPLDCITTDQKLLYNIWKCLDKTEEIKDKVEVEPLVEVFEDKGSEFQCKICKLKFGNKGLLMAHYKKQHKKE